MKISFAHNVHNRHKTLKETILIERKFFPNSNVYVAYNTNDFNLDYFDDLDNIDFTFYHGEKHKIGCVNGCITSIKKTLFDNSDLVVFSHDDVMINVNAYNVFMDNVFKIYNGDYDIICRRPNTYGNEYLMMEGFFLSKESAKKIFLPLNIMNDESEILKDMRNSPSPEVWLYWILNSKEFNINIIDYDHHINNYNEILAQNLGFYHKNAGLRGWND